MENRPVSLAAMRTGRSKCDLCHGTGSPRNPLTRHHVDGNPKNNSPSNHMVLHRCLCHTFGDFITQWMKHHGKKATTAQIKLAWQTFNWKEAV